MNGSTKIVLWALGVLTTVVIALAVFTSMANAEHGERLGVVETRVEGLEKQYEKIDEKLEDIRAAVEK